MQFALRVRVYANCRVRRIFLSDRLYPDWELPACFRVRSQRRASSSSDYERDAPQVFDEEATGKKRKGRAKETPTERVAEVMVL